MRQRIVATASAMVLALGLAAAPVSAGPPTEISVTPSFQEQLCLPATGGPRAYWTVGLSGGTSGSYFVTVHYGDGSVKSEYRSGSYDTHHDFVCGGYYYGQTWSASRGGGGTGTATSGVHMN